MPGGDHSVNVHLAQNVLFAGELKRLRLDLEGDPGEGVLLKALSLSDQPLGPARLKLVSVAARPALPITGTPAQVVATVRNVGGQPLTGATLKLTVDAGAPRVATRAVRPVGKLEPGASATVSWRYTMGAPGPAGFTITGPQGMQAATQIVASRPFPRPKTQAKPAAAVGSHAAWIGNDKVQLVLSRAKEGFSTGQLRAIEEGKPKPMAALPHLASLVLQGHAEPAHFAAASVTASQEEQEASITLPGQFDTRRGPVDCTIAFSLKPGKSYIDVSYALSAPRDLKIAAFRGPWLWAGEGSFADEQDLALFPGVEYLVKGERSSSTLDIAPPKNLRFAPHPNTVTVPSMAVEADGAIVGLMWDPLQKWSGEHQKPTAVFASPNFVEGHANHLLGLCLPSIPQWMDANELVAREAFALSAGEQLRLKACLYAEARSDVLRSMELYFDRYGIPPLPPKARSYQETLAMGLKAYEDVLWVEKAQGWMPVIGWDPGRSQSVALTYALASRHLEDQQWADKLAQKALKLADQSDLSLSLNSLGEPCRALSEALSQARVGALRAPKDGRYGFKPADERRKSLGSPGSSASGICARGVRPLLANALRTGDQGALDAAMPALEFIKRFKVPRASQVWEVPVHTPDVLASADVCEVYLMAYQLTGDVSLLKQAVYWARTGLPFIYMWQAPEQRPLMLGGSIAVFGATFYTGSWFARPVQWNGLEYARVLLDLARYDKSLPWRHFAEMITISGMNQQSTREIDYGAYTDNWDVIDDVECTVCMLAPGRIMLNALALMGRPRGVCTRVIRNAEEGRICINSGPLVRRSMLRDGILDLDLACDPGHTAYTTVMPVAEPTQIEVDGAELTKRGSPIDVVEGWSYSDKIGCVTLKLKYGSGSRRVRIIKAQTMEPEPPASAWEFNQDDRSEGWVAAHDVKPFVVGEGTLAVEATGPDPYIYSPPIVVDAAKLPTIAFRAKTSVANGQLFFATEEGGFAPERSAPFTLPADGEFHEVRIDLSDHPQWKGIILQFRLDFAPGPCSARLDWVRLLPKKGESS